MESQPRTPRSAKDVLSLWTTVLEAFASLLEAYGKAEEHAGLLFDQNMFNRPEIVQALTSSPAEDVGKFFKLAFEVGPLSQKMGDVTKLKPEEKVQLAKDIRNIVNKYTRP